MLVVSLSVIALIQVICVLALIDQYRGLLQIRASLGLVDSSKEIDLAAVRDRVTPSSLGLPAAVEAESRAVVVFLSTHCSTCLAIASGLGGHVRSPLWLVVEGLSPETAEKWLSGVGLSHERVLQDSDGAIAERLSLDVVPSALVFERGELVRAATLPSIRQLNRIVTHTSTTEAARGAVPNTRTEVRHATGSSH